MVLLSLAPSKSGLSYLSRWLISLKFEDKKTLGLKLFQVWRNLITVYWWKKRFKIENRKGKGGNAYMAAKNFSKIVEKYFFG